MCSTHMKQAQANMEWSCCMQFSSHSSFPPSFVSMGLLFFFKDCSLATRRREESGLTDLRRLFALIEKEGSLYAYVLHAGSITFFYLNSVLWHKRPVFLQTNNPFLLEVFMITRFTNWELNWSPDYLIWNINLTAHVVLFFLFLFCFASPAFDFPILSRVFLSKNKTKKK